MMAAGGRSGEQRIDNIKLGSCLRKVRDCGATTAGRRLDSQGAS